VAESILFWFLAIVSVGCSLMVLLLRNPIFSALSLTMTMVSVAGLFVTLGAYFIAGVQLIVYAGAVMVLFVMVLMLFDLKQEVKAFSSSLIGQLARVGTIGALLGILAASFMGTFFVSSNIENNPSIVKDGGVKIIGQLLIKEYLFGFEILGVLLLVVAVGAVSLARAKGGTHADS
jgi:NADH-quinone oxidoreductase subunit J